MNTSFTNLAEPRLLVEEYGTHRQESKATSGEIHSSSEVVDPTSIGDGSTGIENEEPESSEPITSPFDPSLINVASRPMTIDLLISRMREGEIDLSPDFQRSQGIWNDGAKSRLIESLLIRIPLPAFYFDATDDEKWVVVDGLQRLTALNRFVIKKDLKLSQLEFLTEYNGKNYDELPRNLQRRISESQVTVYLIEKGTPANVKFNLFKRINTGGLPLSPMEIRHALNQGEATKLLAHLSKSEAFKSATADSIRDERMADRECILRFLAFSLMPYSTYKEDLDTFLNNTMVSLNKMSDSQIKDLKKRFLRTMKWAVDIFGTQAFRRPSQAGRRSAINKALFEVWSVNLDNLNDAQLRQLVERKELLNKKYFDLVENREFDNSISFGTGSANRVKHRFREVERLIKEVLQ